MGVTRACTNLFFASAFTPILTFPLEWGRDYGLRKGLRYGRGMSTSHKQQFRRGN